MEACVVVCSDLQHQSQEGSDFEEVAGALVIKDLRAMGASRTYLNDYAKQLANLFGRKLQRLASSSDGKARRLQSAVARGTLNAQTALGVTQGSATACQSITCL